MSGWDCPLLTCIYLGLDQVAHVRLDEGSQTVLTGADI